MRSYNEPTCRNLLTRPLVLGVPTPALLLLVSVVGAIVALKTRSTKSDLGVLVLAIFGYAILRVMTHFSRTGFEESALFLLERASVSIKRVLAQTYETHPKLKFESSNIGILPPDTCDESELLRAKSEIAERLSELRAGQRKTLALHVRSGGLSIDEIHIEAPFQIALEKNNLSALPTPFCDLKHIYSLHALPAVTDPLWIFHKLKNLRAPFFVFFSMRGLEPNSIKRRLESIRRLTSLRDMQSSIDEEVTFEESSRVLEGLVRGEEQLIDVSIVIGATEKLSGLDENHFCHEANPLLTLVSALGLRRRFHRSHTMRLCTGTDLALTTFDAFEPHMPATLKTRRGYPCYFDPQDSRLEAPHWLVVGATGTGKSFFTGAILKRLISQGSDISVLFVDHNRSFRRIVESEKGIYLEPHELSDFDANLTTTLASLTNPGKLAGVELSELVLADRRTAVAMLLTRVEAYLRSRQTQHLIYIVFDECWSLLREDPERIQRAFREYRKLHGAAIAITQSLSDFLRDDSGESIFQNTATRILLRQGEDMEPHRGRLGLNDTEIGELRYLKQVKGVFSECLIKQPFASRIARLYPTPNEHELLRTDNLRAAATSPSTRKKTARNAEPYEVYCD